MSETSIDYVAQQRVIRSLELTLQRLEHGLAMPRDDDAIARTKALLEEARERIHSSLAL
jgi:hypothetical protein